MNRICQLHTTIIISVLSVPFIALGQSELSSGHKALQKAEWEVATSATTASSTYSEAAFKLVAEADFVTAENALARLEALPGADLTSFKAHAELAVMFLDLEVRSKLLRTAVAEANRVGIGGEAGADVGLSAESYRRLVTSLVDSRLLKEASLVAEEYDALDVTWPAIETTRLHVKLARALRESDPAQALTSFQKAAQATPNYGADSGHASYFQLEIARARHAATKDAVGFRTDLQVLWGQSELVNQPGHATIGIALLNELLRAKDQAGMTSAISEAADRIPDWVNKLCDPASGLITNKKDMRYLSVEGLLTTMRSYAAWTTDAGDEGIVSSAISYFQQKGGEISEP